MIRYNLFLPFNVVNFEPEQFLLTKANCVHQICQRANIQINFITCKTMPAFTTDLKFWLRTRNRDSRKFSCFLRVSELFYVIGNNTETSRTSLNRINLSGIRPLSVDNHFALVLPNLAINISVWLASTTRVEGNRLPR